MTELDVVRTQTRLNMSGCRLVIAGFTARDEAAVARHIEELEEIGVAAPASVPSFYEVTPDLLTTEPEAAIMSSTTSGEVEPVLVRHAGVLYLGVGSDHTDRALEAQSIHASKAACPKPLGPVVIPLEQVPAWNTGRLTSSVNGCHYQAGDLGQLRDAPDLLERLAGTVGDDGGDLVMFMGTVPLLGGVGFTYGQQWTVALTFPDEMPLTHTYTTRSV